MEYSARVDWRRTTATFNAKAFDRTHMIHLGRNFSIEASSAPEFAGRADLPNPEELFIASIASCFMLTFLYWAAAEGLVIDQYSDDAKGLLTKNEEGRLAVTEVVLSPQITFHQKNPSDSLLKALLNKAHENCFISSSVKTKITVHSKQLMTAST